MKRKKLNVEYKRDFNKKVKLRSAKTEKFYYTSTEKNTSIIIFLSVDNFTRGHIMRNSDFSKKIWEASILCDISSNIYYKFLVDGIEKIDKTQKYIEVIPGEIFNIKNVKEKTVKSEVLSDNVIIIDESDDDVSILSQKKFNISSVAQEVGAAANDLSLSAFLKETAKDHLIKEGDLTCRRKSELDEIAVCILKKSVNLRDLKRMWRNILNSQFSDICSWSKPATNFKEFDNDFNAADHQSLRVRIPVASSLLFGTAEPPLTDGKKLSYNQCFVNIMRDGENVVILVNVPEFSHISDVIIFPTQGPVPHAYQASGGDLDGDKFLVIWDQNFIPKTSVKSFDYNTTVMRNTIYNAFKRRNIPVIPTKPCETDLDFFISSKPFERVGKIDSLIRKYQLSLQAESEAESDETLMLLNTIFNLGVDDEEGIPEIDTLLSVLEREINLKSSSKLSTFGELENWFLKELKSCKRIFEERFELFYLTDVFWDTFKQSVVKLRLKFKEKTNILDNLPFKREFESEVKSLHIIEMEKIQNFRKNVEYDFDISSCNFNNLHQRLFYEIKLKFGAQRLFNIQQVFQEIIFEKIFVKIKSFGVCNGINNCNVKETFTTDRMVQLEKNFKSFILAYKNDAVKGKMFSKNEKKLDCISWKSTDITSYSSSSTISNISQLEESERYIECLLKREANFLKFLNNILHCDEKRLAHSSIHEVGRVVDVEVELIKRASTTLAIYDYGRDIVESIKKFNLTILISDTGSGKSHCIPQILLNEKIITSENTSMKPIIVAQPMRNAAASLANYSKEFRNTKLGEEVGYNLGGERTVANKLVTQLIYVTHGILLGQCTSNSSFSQYSVIFVDECHELSSQLFLLLSYLKRALVFNKELRVVLMSASLKERSLVDFFGECNVIKCRNKRGYPVETVFMDRPFNTNIVDACVDVASNLHKTKTSKLPSTMYEDILVFLPTSRDIETACSQMRKLKLENLAILPFYSSLPEEIKKSVISNSVNRNYRRVIFATNIAETSITFSNLGYIVDSGLQFQVKECLVTGIKNRNVVNISQSSHLQRKGRVGRTHAGTMFCLYSKDDLDNFKKEYDPEFENLEITILRMVKCNIDFYNFQWYKTPTEKEISHTVEQLLDLDMLEKRNDIFSCTLFGEILLETACLGFEAKHLLMLIYSIDLNCFDECLTILSFLIYQKPFKLRDANDQVFNCVHEIDRNLIVDLTYDEEEEEILLIPNPFVKYSSSMLLCISHDYHEYLTNINSEQKKKFCTDNNLCYNAMKYISKIKNKCKKVLKTIDFEQKVKKILVLNEEKKQLEFNLNNLKFKPVNAASPMLERLRYCFFTGFYKNLCVFNYDESHSRNDLVVTLMFKRKNFKYAVIAKSEENFFNFKKPFHDYVEEESTDYITGRYVFYCFTNITCISNKLIVSGLEHIPSIFLSAGTYGLPERFRKMFEELFLNY
ncbi:putative ATP-dependent RNA helicase dhr2 [Clydaea vesicula]|uniref:RNA-dependent RNA polymerase n=1 Tax=Clydaea vesicula TaxID=447962 RepID=A0AAD5TXG5_9FUNG|nr:putative ATP-dependent RNA helicase dhr2 [Clydaea vesicula]